MGERLPLVVLVTGSRHWGDPWGTGLARLRHDNEGRLVDPIWSGLREPERTQAELLHDWLRRPISVGADGVWSYEEPGKDNTLLLVGDATGLDSAARHFAEQFGWEVQVHIAQWSRFGKRAGPERNALMVRKLMAYRASKHRTVIGAFPLPGSRGTWDCVRFAESKEFRPWVCRHFLRTPADMPPRTSD